MPNHFITDLRTTTVTAAAGDSVVVDKNGTVSVPTSQANGITGSDNLRATILGSVLADNIGILALGRSNHVVVGQEGYVFGNNSAVNLGGATGGVTTNDLINEGTIVGGNRAVTMRGVSLNVSNAGLITSASGFSIVMEGGITTTTNLSNTGTIVGGASGYDRQAILALTGHNTIANTGLIDGAIKLGEGWDTYDGRGGVITGQVDLGNGRNSAFGGDGNEEFAAGSGDDFIDGGAGVDTYIFSGTQNVTVDLRVREAQNTGSGSDTILNIENLYTGSRNDTVIGDDGANFLLAGEGNDTLEGWYGNDNLFGEDGTDTAVFSGVAGATVNLSLGGQTQNTGYGLDVLASIENLTGGSGADRFTGDANANLLAGAGGNDTLQGGDGNDTLNGGSGTDTAIFSGNRSQYTITPNSDGSVTISGPDGTDLLRDIRLVQFNDRVEALSNAAPAGLTLSNTSTVENAPIGSVVANLSATDTDGDGLTYALASATSNAFAIVGNSLVVSGALDFESAREHRVTIQAKDNYDGVTTTTVSVFVTDVIETTSFSLKGGSGVDTLAGDAGHDTIYSGSGNDVLQGNAGKDIFVFDTRTNKSTNVDRILDFRYQDDGFWLDNKVFTKLGSGTASKPKKFKSDMFVEGKKAKDAEDRIVYDKKTGALYYDQDGTGSKTQVKIATISNKTKLYYHDFFVI